MTAQFQDTPILAESVCAAGPAGPAAGKTLRDGVASEGNGVGAEIVDGMWSTPQATTFGPEARITEKEAQLLDGPIEPGTPSGIFCFGAWDTTPTAPSSSTPGLVSILESWLRSPMAHTCCNGNGFVPIHNAISLCAELKKSSGGHLHTVEAAVRACAGEGPIILSPEGRAAQLRSFFEKIQEDISEENQTLPPGWHCDWDHGQKRFIYLPCNDAGACFGPPSWDKPSCYSESGGPAILPQLAPQEVLPHGPETSPLHVALEDLTSQFPQVDPHQAETQAPLQGLRLETSAPREQELPDESECMALGDCLVKAEHPHDSHTAADDDSGLLGMAISLDRQAPHLDHSKGNAAIRDLELAKTKTDEQGTDEDPFAVHDPWQVEPSMIDQDPFMAGNPWLMGAPTRTQDHALRWAQWMESMNSNMDIPDAWGRVKKFDVPADLYVSGMGDLASPEFLHGLFGTIRIESIRLPKDSSGAPKGFAFIVLADKEQVDEAIRRLHDKPIGSLGKALHVSRPRMPTGPNGRKGMDGKNASSKGKRSGYHGMGFGFKGNGHGVKGRDAIFKGKGRSYEGKGFEQDNMANAMVQGGSFFGTHGGASGDAQFLPPLMQAMPEPSMVAVCGSNLTLQQGWFQDSNGGLLPCSYWAPSEAHPEVPGATDGMTEACDALPPEASEQMPGGAEMHHQKVDGNEDPSGLALLTGVGQDPSLVPGPRQAVNLPDPEPEPEQQTDHVLLRTCLEEWLHTPLAAESFSSDGSNRGFLPIQLVIDSCPEFNQLSGGSPEAVAAAIQTGPPDGLMALSEDRTSVRPRGLLERARLAAEMYVAKEPTGNISLLDLLTSPPVDAILNVIPETTERLQTLKDALIESLVVQVCGSRVVWRQIFCYEGNVASDLYFPQMALMSRSPSKLERTSAGQVDKENVEATTRGVKPWHLDRRAYVCKQVADLLRSPEVQQVANLDPDGWMPITRLFDFSIDFSNKMFRNVSVVIKGISGEKTQTVLCLDADKHLVRLLNPSERLTAITEQILIEKTPPAELQLHMQPVEVAVEELLEHPDIKEAFQQVGALPGSRWRTKRSMLRSALEESDNLKVRADEMLGTWVAVMIPIDEVLQRELERFLERDQRANNLLKHEGEVPLAWVASERPMQRTFARIKTQDLKDVELQVLRSAVQKSPLFELDDTGVSIRSVDHSHSQASMIPTAQPESHKRQSWHVREKRQPWRVCEKDAKSLRKLLTHYFDPFNLQHNRVLMAVIYEQRRRRDQRGYLRGAGHRPAFSLHDLSKLPRISKLLELYEDASSWLLAAALKTDEKLPVRLCQQRDPRAPRGAWASPDPKIELSYIPSFRFVQVVRDGPETEALLAPAYDPFMPRRHLPEHAFNVVSFSISSDLSHSQSPKSMDVVSEITAGGLDPATMTWESRLPKIRRQLLQYCPDIICVQGVQSIGFAERCSELEASWFNSDNEPTSNHLVYLYRELSKENYGVTFSPTLKLPGSAVVCFGNAIFWKRSRWQVEHRWAIQRSAICAILSSKLSRTQLAICSSKSPAAYIRDWGSSVANADLIEPMRAVQDGLLEAATTSDARSVWCGDFACEPQVILPGLLAPTSTHAWQSASMSVSDGEPVWTSVSKYTAGREVDLVLHDSKLEVLAGLGGLAQPNSLVELLKSGYSSDHLLQMVAFTEMSQSHRVHHVIQEKENSFLLDPNLGKGSIRHLPADSRWRVPMARTRSEANRESDLSAPSLPPGLSGRLTAFQ